MGEIRGLQTAASLKSYTVVYGGSFDPPHVGHQLACVYLLEALGADEVWLVPAYKHAFHKPLSPFDCRVEMCKRMVGFLGDRVSVQELERDLDHGGKTLELLKALQQRHPRRSFALSVGADILGERERWHRWGEIEQNFPVVLLGRAGYPSSAPVALPELSSSEVRRRVAAQESLVGFVPTTVADLIHERGLYNSSDGA